MPFRALVASLLVCLCMLTPTAHAAPAEYGATIAAAGGGRLDVFTVGADRAIWQKTYSPATGWGDWASIGGHATSQPRASTRPDGRIDVVARGAGDHAWSRSYLPAGDAWGRWRYLTELSAPDQEVVREPLTPPHAAWASPPGLPPPMTGVPDAAWSHDGTTLQVVAVGGDGEVWFRSGAGEWESLGAPNPVYSPVSWYGEDSSTCWQVGFPAADTRHCSDVSAGFLADPGSVRLGAVGAGITVPASGHFCNYYNLGPDAHLAQPDPADRSGTTGFRTSAPHADWQHGDLAGNVCQAEGSRWGFAVLGGAANDHCRTPYAPCGMQQYVSFAGQAERIRPWSSSFAAGLKPSLVVSARSDPHVANVSGGAWGYVCPIVKDMRSGNLVEYCFEQWRVGAGFPRIAGFDVAAACASYGGHNIDQVITQFAPGTRFATQLPGTASRYTFAPGTDPPPATFGARISETELIRAIDAVGAACGRPLSRNPADYAVIGVEHGIEGGDLTLLGASTSDLGLVTVPE